MQKIRKYGVFLFLLGLPYMMMGQDPQFTQFYANPLYLGPSFAGATKQHRVAGTFRDQWPGFPGGFISYNVSYDHNFSNYNSGVGVIIMRDQAGSGKLSNTSITVSYSYDFNVTERWHIRPGIGFAYALWGIDFNKLVFSDQLYSGFGNPQGITTIEEPPIRNYTGDIDAASSLLIYEDRFWIGATADHLLKPNQAFWGEKSIVPMKFSYYGGYQIVKYARLLKPIDETVSLAYLYKTQGNYKQLDVGLYWYHYPLMLGAWYRGLPPSNGPRGDALAFLVGFKIEGISIGYSYDVTVSNLVGKTHGAHEISLSYQFVTQPIKKMHAIPCPEF